MPLAPFSPWAAAQRRARVLAVQYLLRDEFTTPQTAPLAGARTCEPGPGLLSVTDTANNLAISGGRLQIAGGVTWGNPGIWGVPQPRVVGRAVSMRLNHGAASGAWRFGFSTTDSGALAVGFQLNDTTLQACDTSDNLATLNYGKEIQPNSDYDFMVSLRTAGQFYWMKRASDTMWTLLWMGGTDTSALRPALTNFNSSGTLDNLRVLDLGALDARFASDYGLATSRIAGAVSAGQTFTHTPDFLLDFTVATRGADGNNTNFILRQQDANNYFYVSFTSAGNINFYEVVNGGYNVRIATPGDYFNSGQRVVVLFDGYDIKVYVNGAFAATGTASAVTSGTAAQLIDPGGVISDLIAWPRTVSIPRI